MSGSLPAFVQRIHQLTRRCSVSFGEQSDPLDERWGVEVVAGFKGKTGEGRKKIAFPAFHFKPNNLLPSRALRLLPFASTPV